MSEERIKAFHERVKVDTSLQKKFKAAPDVETIAAIAAESVFQLDADNSLRMLMWEFQEAELEGGDWWFTFKRMGVITSLPDHAWMPFNNWH